MSTKNVAALEWAADRIRVNHVEPDAVFDTAIWIPELLEQLANVLRGERSHPPAAGRKGSAG
ncbi:hypothetical protein [Phytoactinopolyspora limicola]|uniref:hypothetical protein n=1 Tax=Phytoactinopolyspora limicola TaxID=2715536 RepID=UPI001407DC5B|nr:hypothetical protein [Phytoactinopolyspora limicola]